MKNSRRIAIRRYRIVALDMENFGRKTLRPSMWATKMAFVVKDLVPAVDTTPVAVILRQIRQ